MIEMTIQPYRLYIPNWDVIKDDFLMHLQTMDVGGNERDGRYGFVEVDIEGNLIHGYFAQESTESLVKYENKLPEFIGEYRWIRTPFIIDINSLIIYINVKRYSSRNLYHGKLLSRIQEMLSEELNETVNLAQFYSGVIKDDFKRIFYNDENIITQIKVSSLQGSYIVDGTDLHNPREEFDKIRMESHNVYDARILKAAHLEANENENLSKSPTARAFIEGQGSVGEMIKYLSLETGELITEHNKGDAKIKVKIPENVDNEYEVFSVIRQSLERNSGNISRFVIEESTRENIEEDDDDE